MFDLKKWQRNLKEEFMNDVEKAKVWSNQINPVIEELLPIWDGLYNRLEQQAQQQVVSVQPSYPITCFAARSGQMTGFFSMVDDAFNRHVITRQPFNENSYHNLLKVLKHHKDPLNIATPIWIHAGICYGDEQLLQQQQIPIRLYSGNKEIVLKGYYAQYDGALQTIEQLLKKARQIQQTIPFVPDYYASRFYVLKVDELDDDAIKEWTTIDRVEIAPFDQSIEEAIDFHLYEEPIWNVEVTTLEPRRGTRKLVSNGYHRREFVSTIETKWLPLIPENGVFCSFEVEPGMGLRATVELPDFISTLPVAIFQNRQVERQMIHNEKNTDAQIHHSQQPTIADFQQLIQMYDYVRTLSIQEAKLELQAAKDGALWRRDCIVLTVTSSELNDVFIESRMRALEQLIINYWPYATCRVELKG